MGRQRRMASPFSTGIGMDQCGWTRRFDPEWWERRSIDGGTNQPRVAGEKAMERKSKRRRGEEKGRKRRYKQRILPGVEQWSAIGEEFRRGRGGVKGRDGERYAIKPRGSGQTKEERRPLPGEEWEAKTTGELGWKREEKRRGEAAEKEEEGCRQNCAGHWTGSYYLAYFTLTSYGTLLHTVLLTIYRGTGSRE